MQVKFINGALVIDGPESVNGQAVAPADFSDKPLSVELEDSFYIALDKDGLLARSVSVNIADRKTVAVLVGNWVAEGFHPQPVDLKTYAKHVRALVAARKPAKNEADASAAPADDAGAPAAAGGGDI
ncbi:hypothetical protein KTD31_00835 [Burkholderia multivorans]|uniref:hypothetical protein n=1 Tax=Burkholderia multivorans TaxID=87883 RepID=UPI001C2418DD|nr:hypothetical protein [Burkholderia multivorans]MBU9199946.1 hypothetical protein [Burkholderia multivorans]MDN8078935.1 hypothetical protein [Burkholderia multivorans]